MSEKNPTWPPGVKVEIPPETKGKVALPELMRIARKGSWDILQKEFKAEALTPVFRTSVGRFPCTLSMNWEKFLQSLFSGIDLHHKKTARDDVTLVFEKSPCARFTIPFVSNGENIMNFEFRINPPLKMADLVERVACLFDVPASDVQLRDIFGDVFTEMESDDLVSCIISEKLVFVCDLDGKVIKGVKQRQRIVTEFIDTEASYRKILDFNRDYLLPFFENYSIVCCSETMTALEGFFGTAIEVHQEMTSNIDMEVDPFFISIGQLLLASSQSFKDLYMKYPELCASVRNKLSEYVKGIDRDEFDMCWQLWTAPLRNEGFSVGTIDSCLFWPLQRIAKYLLFIGRCIETTPVGHMDWPSLLSAKEKLDDMKKESNWTENVDNRDKSQENFDMEMGDLKEFVKLEDWQGFLGRYDVVIDSRRHAVVLFTDQLMIGDISNVKNPTFAVFGYLELNCQTIDASNVAIYSPKASYIAGFGDAKTAAAFLDKVTDASVRTQCATVQHNAGLSWKKLSIDLPKLHHHAMCEADGKIWIFGGRTDKENISDVFMCVDPKTREVVTLNVTGPCARYDAQMCSFNKSLFLYSGVSVEGCLRDMWKYSKGSGWQEIGTPDDAPSGSGLSVVKFKDGLLITGKGKSKDGGKDEFVSYIFKPDEEEWIKCPTGSDIPAVVGHTVAVLNDTAYLYGGTLGGDKMMKDIYVFQESQHIWTHQSEMFSGLLPLPRVRHCMVTMKGALWIIGGIGSSIPFVMTPNSHWLITRNEGNPPVLLSCFGIAYYKQSPSGQDELQDSIYIYGGRDENGVTENIYEVTVVRPERLKLDTGA